MEDRNLMQRISALVEEEHRLLSQHGQGGLNEDERQRLHALEVTLDRSWDLLRQRRARRDAGLDPDEAQARPTAVVERYRQ